LLPAIMFDGNVAIQGLEIRLAMSII